MDMSFVIGVLVGALQAGTSVLYAALGEVIVERAGVINLGLEGSMLMGAVGRLCRHLPDGQRLGWDWLAAALAGASLTWCWPTWSSRAGPTSWPAGWRSAFWASG